MAKPDNNGENFDEAVAAAQAAGHTLVVDDNGRYLTTEDGELIVTETGEPINFGEASAPEVDVPIVGSASLQMADDTLEASGVVRNPVNSASWTGRRSISQQAAVVRDLAPRVLVSLEQVTGQVEAGLPNDPVVLNELRDLHTAIGDLLRSAKHRSLNKFDVTIARDKAERVIINSDQLLRAVWKSPTLTIGTLVLVATMLGISPTILFAAITAEFIKNAR